MLRRKRRLDEKPVVELVEEAFHLVRHAPAAALVAYCVGSLPFVLGLLYFWSDMARSAFAEERLLTGSLVMTFLFFWMKGWHSVYARTLTAHLCGEAPPRWRLRWFLRATMYQAIVQPLGILLLPITLPLIIPFGWAYSFFNSATVLAGGDMPDVKTLVRRSWRQMCLWSMQAQFAIFLFKIFGLFVLINLFAALFALPYLAKSLLGIESVITRSPWAALNTTALAGVFALAWLCLDPFIKAVYVLRCFQGESLQTGQDLRAELKTFTAPAQAVATVSLLVVVLLATALHTSAAETTTTQNSKLKTQNSLPPHDLDRSIDDVIQKREYSWRLPRESAAPKDSDESQGAIAKFIKSFFKSIETGLKAIGRTIKDFIDWMTKQGPKTKSPGLGGLSLGAAMEPLLYLLIAALVGALIWLIVRAWQRRGPREEVVAEAITPMPDVADENVGADQLPEDGWVRLARDLLARGELRLALRAFYLASLAALAERNLITLAKFKSNRDYERELLRRSHALAEVPQMFTENVSVFERVWYGLHDVTPELLDDFSRKVERIKTGA
jgi:hypothetical protein